METVHPDKFGTCCKDLHDAMTAPPEKFVRVESHGVLFLTIGYMTTERGPGFYDMAIIFCPFCGKRLQTKEGIKAAADAR